MEIKNLSPRELLHFALHASKNGRTDFAIQYLKQLVTNEPENLDALFLLGSEYAEISLFDEAISSLQKALTIAPDAHIVRFQLGMLFLTLNQNENASEHLKNLETLPEDNAIFHYAKGLQAIIENDLETSKSYLKQGLSLPNDNPSLKSNISKLLENISTAAQDEPTGFSDKDDNASSMFLSVYDS